ncbi:hypothetical protein [Roseibium marinum]|uniref:hypothetical protein n=1 Tax=Roseibium marinum TaxID=281252 RepID=UPI00147571C3|nr:hypothetical protein [Roseibium marinum]
MQQKQDFERRVEELFRLAGLSVVHPHTQANVTFDNDRAGQMPPPPPPPPPRGHRRN